MFLTISPNRYFHTSEGWYICVRPGDIQHRHNCDIHEIDVVESNGRLIAGPFVSEKSTLRWFNQRISLNGSKSKITSPPAYLPDEVVIPDCAPWNMGSLQTDYQTHQ